MTIWNDPWRANLPATRDQVQQWGDGFLIEKEITFTAATADDVFAVTGVVAVRVFGIITVQTTTTTATAELGTGDTTDALIDTTTGANLSTADVGAVWHNDAPQTNPEVGVGAFDSDMTIISGEDIVLTSGASLDDGSIMFYCYWKPISEDGTVEPAS